MTSMRKNERPTFLLTVRAMPDVDAIRSLRAWVKRGVRDFGLRCLEVREGKPEESEMGLDMRNYASKFIKPDQLREGPIQTRILAVFEGSGQYGRPMLELENGSQFSLNDGNLNTLINAFGHDSDGWIGQETILELGTYKDWKSSPPVDKETVKVRAVAPDGQKAGNSGALPAPVQRKTFADDLSDDVPF